MESLAVFLLMKILMDYIAFGMHNLKPIIISILSKVLEERWLTDALPNIQADVNIDQHPTASSSLMRKDKTRLEESIVPPRKQLDILSNGDFTSRQGSCKTPNLRIEEQMAASPDGNCLEVNQSDTEPSSWEILENRTRRGTVYNTIQWNKNLGVATKTQSVSSSKCLTSRKKSIPLISGSSSS
ncbi:hypothetical protein X975_16694, partial [Stegodyphus mimosarum]